MSPLINQEYSLPQVVGDTLSKNASREARPHNEVIEHFCLHVSSSHIQRIRTIGRRQKAIHIACCFGLFYNLDSCVSPPNIHDGKKHLIWTDVEKGSPTLTTRVW